jgi:hypothetical protein
MVNQPTIRLPNITNTAYCRRTTSIGDTYLTRQKQVVECPECGATVQQQSLRRHRSLMHGIDSPTEAAAEYDAPNRGRTSLTPYQISMPKKQREQHDCPVPLTTPEGMRRHFMTHHPLDSICIMEEGGQPLDRCKKCNLHASYKALNGKHINSRLCRKGEELQER